MPRKRCGKTWHSHNWTGDTPGDLFFIHCTRCGIDRPDGLMLEACWSEKDKTSLSILQRIREKQRAYRKARS